MLDSLILKNLLIFLYLLGIFGLFLNKRSILISFICIELSFYCLSVLIIIDSFIFDDISGQFFSLFMLGLAAVESVIGLSFLIAYYKLFRNIFI